MALFRAWLRRLASSWTASSQPSVRLRRGRRGGQWFSRGRGPKRLRARDLYRLTDAKLFERLEPIVLLATDSWTGIAGDGLWTTPGNWSTNAVPTSSDDAVISGNYAITFNSGTQSLAAHSIALSSGASLTYNSPNTATVGTSVTLGSGTTVTVDAGAFTSANFVDNGTLVFNLSGAVNLAEPVSGTGSLTLTSTSNAVTQNAAITVSTLNVNAATGITLNNASNAVSTLNASNSGSGNIALTNAAALTVGGISQTGSGTITLANTGAVTIGGAVTSTGSGAISLTAAGTDVAMNVNANVSGANAPLTLYATGNLNVNSGAQINSGAANLTIGADMTPAGSGDNGTGTLSINGTAQLYGATMTLRGADENVASTATVGSATAATTPGGVSTFATTTGQPDSIVFDSQGNLYAAIQSSSNIYKITPTGVVSLFAVTGQSNNQGIAIDAAGNLYVSEIGNAPNYNITKITPSGVVSTFNSSALLSFPEGLAVDSSGNVYVANYTGKNVLKISPDGSTVSTFADFSGSSFEPTGLAFDASGNLYVDSYAANGPIYKVTPGGTISTFASTPFETPYYLAFDSAGNLYVPNRSGTPYGNTVTKVTPSGTASTYISSTQGLNNPAGVAVDSAGNLYIANLVADTISETFPSYPATSQVTIQSSVESRPMQIGGSNNSAVSGINLTSAELSRIVTAASGAITFGDASQTGNITFTTANPATTPGAGVSVNQSGTGQIILDDGSGSAAALTAGGGAVTLNAGSGGIVELSTDKTGIADFASASSVALAGGALGSSSKPLQFAATNLTTNTSASNSSQFISALAPVASNGLNAGSGTVTLVSGMLTGTGTITGNLSNAGTVNPGTVGGAGTLNVTGNYTQTSTGTLAVDIGGTTVGTQYDRLAIGGTASMSGSFNSRLVNGFSPSGGQSFTPLTYGSFSGGYSANSVYIQSVVGTAVLPANPVLGATSMTISAQTTGTDYWTGNAHDGLWATAGNWSHGTPTGGTQQVPVATDDVVIGSGFSTISLPTQASTTVNSVTASSPLSLPNAAKLFLSAPSSFSDVSISTGTLTDSSNMSVSGALTWTSGTIGGTGTLTVGTSGTISLSTNGTMDLNTQLVNQGTATISASASLSTTGGGLFTNQGTVNAASGPIISTNFDNQATGIVNVTQGATFSGAFTTNEGTVNATSGTLWLEGSSTTSGTFSVSASATVELFGTNAVFTAASAITGAGTLDINTNGASDSLAGSVSIASVVAAVGTVTIDGTYNVSGSTSNSGANLTFNPDATLTSLGSALNISNGTTTINTSQTAGIAT
ncbi:MAG TPA: hypothetical protein VFI31_30650, partial [Pirellulales bacterium]|nr:hypothetical protein [Pirellulales bacterium]